MEFLFCDISNTFAMSSFANGPGTSIRKAVGPKAKVTVVLGAQWGDEGKGKLVDILATEADVVCRCQVSKMSDFNTINVSLKQKRCFMFPHVFS